MNDEFLSEVNELISQGFNSEDQSWRERSEIKPVENFKPIDGVPQLNTYGKMETLSEAEVRSGEYRQKLIRFGRGSAEHFLRIFHETVGDSRAIVSFLNGAVEPHADGISRDGDSYTIRGYHDFGIAKV